MSNAERLIVALAPLFAEGEREVNQALIEEIGRSLASVSAEEITGSMIGDSTFSTEFEGVDGLEATWADWLDTFKRVTLELQEIEEIGDNVLVLVNQIGTTRHGVAVEQPSAAVWKFSDGLVVRVEFHLDRERARESAQLPA